MRFFRATDGSLYPVSSIRRIGPARKATYQGGREFQARNVYLVDDEKVEIDDDVLSNLQERPEFMFAAAPETHILHYDAAEHSFWAEPVVGWAQSHEGILYPVTPDGVNSGVMYVNQTIRTADGAVSEPGLAAWPSVDDWMAAKKSEQGA